MWVLAYRVAAALLGAAALRSTQVQVAVAATPGMSAGDRVLGANQRIMVQEYHIPGIAPLVARDGRPIAVAKAGYCSVPIAVPASETCVFHLALAAKIFTEVAFIILAEEGKVGRDDKAISILTDLPAAWSSVPVRHLLSYTSGIPAITDNPEFRALPQDQRASSTRTRLCNMPRTCR